MGSSRPQDRSLHENTFLPQWMKGRFENRFDFDESSFSPPSHDDNFFYLRYPRKPEDSKQSFRTIDNSLHGHNNATSNISQVTPSQTQTKDYKQVDFSKHHPACQPFVNIVNNKVDDITSKITVNRIESQQLSNDKFGEVNSESALCGRSIIHVANQMMSSKNAKAPSHAAQKNVSKSLPATPIASPINTPDSSPKSRRRVVSNRYFTGPFIPDREKYQAGGWILAGLLGQSREVIPEKILEEEEPPLEPHRTLLNRKKSISSQNLTYIGKEEKPEKAPISSQILQPRPSEFREMNFWSPTSM